MPEPCDNETAPHSAFGARVQESFIDLVQPDAHLDRVPPELVACLGEHRESGVELL
jgi:hypothetical protein